MKRGTLIAVLTAIMIMACSVFSFADDGLKLVSSYPEDGQTNTSMENLGVKLTFNNPINSEEAKKIDKSKFSIVDEEGKKVPTLVLFSDKNDGLVLVIADIDQIVTALHGAGQRLETDVVGSAVTAEGDELVGVVNAPPLFQCMIGCLHTGKGSSGTGECIVDITVLIRGIGIHE